jgi:ribose transport system substrate-binding protein
LRRIADAEQPEGFGTHYFEEELNMKKLVSLVLVAMLLALMSIACFAEELPAADVAAQGFNAYDKAVSYNDIKDTLGPIPRPTKALMIGFCAKAFENEFWRMEKEGAEAAAKAMKDQGIDITMDAQAAQGESDEQGQLAVMNVMVNKAFDGILCSAIADGNLLPGVESAVKAGIPLVTVNDAFMPQIHTTVGAWHLEGAELAAKWIAQKINNEGQVAIIQGLPKNEAARIRTEGFKNWITANCPNIEIVAIQNADWDRTKAKDVADIWLKQFPDLKAIYANNDTMAMGALESLRAVDKIGKVLLVGCDGTSEALGSVKAGELSATVNNFPYFMSQIGLEMMLREIGGQEIPKVIYTPQVVIDVDNAGQDDATLIGWTGFKFADK